MISFILFIFKFFLSKDNLFSIYYIIVNYHIGFNPSFHEYFMSQRKLGIITLLLSQVH